MHQIYHILLSTPYYVYFLFIYLMFIGAKSMRDRVITSPMRLLIMPVIILFFSINELSNIGEFLILLISVFVVAIINWSLSNRVPLNFNKNYSLIILGSLQPLLVIISLVSN